MTLDQSHVTEHGVQHTAAGTAFHLPALSETDLTGEPANVFNSPSLAKYSGQIVNKPTMFAFAKGAGIMGEAGPEAIMPLSRGSNGKLGVAMHGGSGDTNVSVTVNIASDGTASVSTAGGDQQFAKQFGEAMASAAQREIAKAIRPGGQIYNTRGRG